MTAPQARSGGVDANTRGIAVLVGAVLIGFVLLLKAGGTGAEGVSTAGGPTTTIDTSGLVTSTTAEGSDTTTTTQASSSGRPLSEIKVLVLNGSGKTGVAASTTATFKAAGYTTLDPGNAASNASTTMVYFAEGYQAEASAAATTVLGKDPNSVVATMPSPLPGPNADQANVVVVLGADTPAADTTSASSTSTTLAQ